MTPLRDVYGPGYTQAEYLRALAAGYETGWWDDNGIPAPWPDASSTSTAAGVPAASPAANPSTTHYRTETSHSSDQQTGGSATTPLPGT